MANLTGYAGVFPGPTSATYTTPTPISVGTRAFDTSGNEYIFCEFSGPVSQGEWVNINDLNVAAALVDTSIGRVGIVMSYRPTSNDSGWVQIYGLNTIAQSSAVTDNVSAALGLRMTSVLTTPLGTVHVINEVSEAANQIFGAWITSLTPAQAGIAGASDGSWPTTYTSQSSSPAGGQHSGVVLGVFLDYPYMDGNDKDRFISTS